MNYVVDKVKEEQKEDVSILTHPRIVLVNWEGVLPAGKMLSSENL